MPDESAFDTRFQHFPHTKIEQMYTVQQRKV